MGVFILLFGVAGFEVFVAAGGVGEVGGAQGVVGHAVIGLGRVLDQSAGLGVGELRVLGHAGLDAEGGGGGTAQMDRPEPQQLS